jgi:hypothetical protein
MAKKRKKQEDKIAKANKLQEYKNGRKWFW